MKKPKLKDLVLAESILDFIDPNDLFNYFTDRDDNLRYEDPYAEFVILCRQNLGFAAKYIIGKGDFELLPFQCAIMDTLWHKTFPLMVASRGAGKSTLLAVYAILRAVLDQSSESGQKIIIISASFRQSKLIMETIDTFYQRSPLLQAASPDGLSRHNDRWQFKFGNSTITALPLGDGQKIRGLRATTILCDEFASIPEEIFNVVVRGFAAVSANPVDRIRSIYEKRKLIKEGLLDKNDIFFKGNQIIRTGTATYEFNHLYKVFSQYKTILKKKLVGRGSDPAIQTAFNGEISPSVDVNYRDLAIIQLPYTSLPDGYMDLTMVNEAKMSMTKEEFGMEYEAKFITDSSGFFKASAIEAATPKPGEPNNFQVQIDGRADCQYVMGIDPARKRDSFGLVILKVLKSTHQVVFAKEWRRTSFGKIALAIRKLCKRYNIERIGVDSAGGGTAIMDFLQAPEMIPEGELPYWELDDKTTKTGRKILDMINYMGKWLKAANYDMAADIEHKRLIFPSHVDDSKISRDTEATLKAFDTIQELKKQLTLIEITMSQKSDVTHFDVPSELKRTARKDLYSALLIAAYEARCLKQAAYRSVSMDQESIGGAMEEFL